MESGQRLDTPPARMGRAHLGAEEWRRVRSRSSPELAPERAGCRSWQRKRVGPERQKRQEGSDRNSTEELPRTGSSGGSWGASETSLQVPFGGPHRGPR